jgi:glycosyltransferase involved in cell wall biosynthesis
MLLAAIGAKSVGAKVKIIVPLLPTSEEFAERCAEDGIECERTKLIAAGQDGPRQNPVSMIRLAWSLKGRVIHFHTGNSSLPRLLLTALALLRSDRIFVTIQSPYETFTATSRQARFWARATRRRVHVVVSPSEHGTAFQRRCGVPDERTATIRNAIDIEAMKSGDASTPLARLGMCANDPLIVFTSRLDSQKRPVDVVEIFQLIATEFPRAQVAIVGNGDEQAGIEQRVGDLGLGDRVHLLGFRTDIPDWLAAATVWILPTERENFSVAVLEALAAGCAVLSTRCPGNDEILVDGTNASVFEIGDVVDAANRLRTLLCEPETRVSLARRGEIDAGQYTAIAMSEQFIDLYRRVAHVEVTSSPASAEH